jgi:hypothetical protein
MGWSGRAPAPPARHAGTGLPSKGAPPCPTNQTPLFATMGIDIGKNSFHVVGLDQRGAIVPRQKWSRGQVEARLANMAPCLIGMEGVILLGLQGIEWEDRELSHCHRGCLRIRWLFRLSIRPSHRSPQRGAACYWMDSNAVLATLARDSFILAATVSSGSPVN